MRMAIVHVTPLKHFHKIIVIFIYLNATGDIFKILFTAFVVLRMEDNKMYKDIKDFLKNFKKRETVIEIYLIGLNSRLSGNHYIFFWKLVVEVNEGNERFSIAVLGTSAGSRGMRGIFLWNKFARDWILLIVIDDLYPLS